VDEYVTKARPLDAAVIEALKSSDVVERKN
jgi:hypothetical protein